MNVRDQIHWKLEMAKIMQQEALNKVDGAEIALRIEGWVDALTWVLGIKELQ